ncbi:MAG: hypothetical protein COV36_01110 [Alphaproteobacteria bacterium CG11_big_fil_rev_8_21_14_0_20_44_7]|nr:MAG: hypothetical protein COV36_01110 [Alphaproteobacteria bacterium CG11_big_fil_rev_8_21_14_0_20_44_7]
MIQVADGAIERLGEILQRQKALAVQGNADTLSDTERGYLDQEFQSLVLEYDRIVSETNFNGTKLLNGNLSGSAITAAAASTGTAATTDITITPANTTTIAAISVSSLGTVANTGSANLDAVFTEANIAAATVVATPSTVVTGDFVTSKYINSFTVTTADSADDISAIANFFNGLATATVTFTGDVADDGTGTVSIVSGGVTFTSGTEDFAGNPGAIYLTDAGSSDAQIRLDLNTLTGTVVDTATLEAADTVIQTELRSSTYATSAVAGDYTLTASDADIAAVSVAGYGSDTEAGLEAVAEFINGLATATTTGASTGGNDGVVTTSIISGGQTFTSTFDTQDAAGAQTFTNAATGATISITLSNQGITTDAAAVTYTNGGAFQTAIRTVTATAVPDGSNYSVTPVINSFAVAGFGTNSTTGVDNVQAFIADFANLQVTVNADTGNDDGSGTITVQAGGITFTSADNDWTNNPASVTLTSTTGNGETLTLDLNNLNLSSNDATGLIAAESTIEDALKGLRTADNSENGVGTIAITIGDDTFTSPSGTTFGGNPTAILFTSDSGNLEVLSIDLADITINDDAGLTAAAAAIQTAVQGLTYTNTFVATAREATTGAAAFQVGTSSSDTISVSISSVASTAVYLDDLGAAQTLSVGTKAGSIAASGVLDNAINNLTSVRADVGAAQSRFNFAASALETSIQNIDAARAGFLDADISTESTTFAQNQVLIQASISVLAQANQLPQNLLKLIG